MTTNVDTGRCLVCRRPLKYKPDNSLYCTNVFCEMKSGYDPLDTNAINAAIARRAARSIVNVQNGDAYTSKFEPQPDVAVTDLVGKDSRIEFRQQLVEHWQNPISLELVAGDRRASVRGMGREEVLQILRSHQYKMVSSNLEEKQQAGWLKERTVVGYRKMPKTVIEVFEKCPEVVVYKISPRDYLRDYLLSFSGMDEDDDDLLALLCPRCGVNYADGETCRRCAPVPAVCDECERPVEHCDCVRTGEATWTTLRRLERAESARWRGGW